MRAGAPARTDHALVGGETRAAWSEELALPVEVTEDDAGGAAELDVGVDAPPPPARRSSSGLGWPKLELALCKPVGSARRRCRGGGGNGDDTAVRGDIEVARACVALTPLAVAAAAAAGACDEDDADDGEFQELALRDPDTNALTAARVRCAVRVRAKQRAALRARDEARRGCRSECATLASAIAGRTRRLAVARPRSLSTQRAHSLAPPPAPLR